ncbi:MAG TPA: class C beta-lactamase [Candidatus Acidoferrales bacterium]|jgi:beta-lactamase class C|nr:class C beta-lactamase [Candidatus Acidoferrales bacterium]
MLSIVVRTAAAALFLAALQAANAAAATPAETRLESAVAQTIRPLMEKYAIPGMAVGIVTNGHAYVFNYGVASKATGKRIGGDTLFEIGSVSKTFTATMAQYAQIAGKLSLSNTASAYLPALRGSAFDNVTLMNLGTHTPGGVPLQVPGDVTNEAQLMTYFKNWKPAYAPGTYRTYSNLSIGLLGVIVAKAMNEDFAALMEGTLFPALGMKHSFITVPPTRMDDYAQGYTQDGAPIRLTLGVLGREAYGVRTTAGDLVRYLEANMRMLDLDPNVQRAILETHTGYYQVGGMTQDLIWEQYAYPADLETLLAGNSAKILFDPNPVVRLDPPSPPADAVLINKTGSTNGFGTYLAFVPAKKFGIVLLANKSYPIDARVTAAYAIMTHLP